MKCIFILTELELKLYLWVGNYTYAVMQLLPYSDIEAAFELVWDVLMDPVVLEHSGCFPAAPSLSRGTGIERGKQGKEEKSKNERQRER